MPSNFHEKLESLECRRDTKARRRLNDNPNEVINITAEEIEKGVTLEQLNEVNTPVHCYGGQLTIHGTMPDFNPNARVNGYKFLFQNGNGSIGVKYGAIDGSKKAIIAKVAKLVDNGWHTHLNSQGFELCRNFYVKDETLRQKAKEDTINAMKSIPGDKFFGSIYAYTLAYGMGYGVCADIGAIPESELWSFIHVMFGVNKSEVETLDNARKEKESEEKSAREIQQEIEYKINMEKKTARLARYAEFLKTLVDKVKVTTIPTKKEFSFIRYDDSLENPDKQGDFGYKTVTIKKRGFRYCYNVKPSITIGFGYYGNEAWKMIEDRHYNNWQEQANKGLLYQP